jgi:photosystem II stability/assembly factor-like uncharacterized protein
MKRNYLIGISFMVIAAIILMQIGYKNILKMKSTSSSKVVSEKQIQNSNIPQKNIANDKKNYNDASISIKSIHMIDESIGWTLSNGKILRTADGGQDWSNVSPSEPALTIEDDEQNQLYGVGVLFFDSNNAWIALDTDQHQNPLPTVKVYHTVNGGKDWSSATLPTKYVWEGDGADIDFVNSQIGWILLNSSVGSGQSNKTLYQTTDGGRTWKEISDHSLTNQFDINNAAHGSVNNMKFINSAEGWIAGSLQGKMYLLKTNDGGNTWNRQDINLPQEYSVDYNADPNKITFSGINKEFGVFSVELQEGNNEKGPLTITYHTIDGGKTWLSFNGNNNTNLTDCTFIDIDNGLATNFKNHKIYYTNDGGRNWSIRDKEIEIDGFTYIDFITKDVGFLVNKGEMFKTVDGGVNWAAINNKDTQQSINTNLDNNNDNNQTSEKSAFYSNLLMVNKTTGWIIRNNKVLRTVNGGVNWIDVSPYSSSKTNDNQPIVSTCFYDSNTAWATVGTDLNDGNNLSVYHTTDGGEYWIKALLPTMEQWEGTGRENISFIDSLNGFILVTSLPALGQMDKSIYKTNDGGKSWLRIGNITDKIASYPTGMTFKNNKEGWITSSNHGQDFILTFKTDDGGYSWHKENLQMAYEYKDYYTNSFQPVFFSNEKKIGILPIEYVKEESRFMIPYITKDGGSSWSVPKNPVNYTFSNYDFFNEKQWWAVGYKDNKLYETSNSGDSWQAIPQDKVFKGIKTLDFVTNQIGWAIGDDFFIKTIDGGKNWSKVAIIQL